MPMLAEELRQDYSYVVSSNAIREAQRLLEVTRPGWEHSVVWICLQQERPSIMDLEGLGREIWQGIDPKRYVTELRREWDAR